MTKLILLYLLTSSLLAQLPKANEIYYLTKVKTVVIDWGKSGIHWNQAFDLSKAPEVRTKIFFEDCKKANNLQDITLCDKFMVKSDTSLIFAGRTFHYKTEGKYYLLDDGYQMPKNDSKFKLQGLLDGVPFRFKGILDSKFAKDILVLGIIRDSKYWTGFPVRKGDPVRLEIHYYVKEGNNVPDILNDENHNYVFDFVKKWFKKDLRKEKK